MLLSAALAGMVFQIQDINGDGDALDLVEVRQYANSTHGTISGPWDMARYVQPAGAATDDTLVVENFSGEVSLMQDINGDGDALDPGETVPWAMGLPGPVGILHVPEPGTMLLVLFAAALGVGAHRPHAPRSAHPIPVTMMCASHRLKLYGCLFVAVMAQSAVADEAVRFNQDIRSILSNHCFACHGPDEKNRESGLRLDKREAALVPADSGMVPIVPGQPEKSELIRRLFAKDPDVVMPPQDRPSRLTSAEKMLIRHWVAAGADYQQHWSLTKSIAIVRCMPGAIG
jgi:hypothetical protein